MKITITSDKPFRRMTAFLHMIADTLLTEGYVVDKLDIDNGYILVNDNMYAIDNFAKYKIAVDALYKIMMDYHEDNPERHLIQRTPSSVAKNALKAMDLVKNEEKV